MHCVEAPSGIDVEITEAIDSEKYFAMHSGGDNG